MKVGWGTVQEANVFSVIVFQNALSNIFGKETVGKNSVAGHLTVYAATLTLLKKTSELLSTSLG